MENDLSVIKLPCGGTANLSRYNTTIARHLQTLPYDWLTGMLVRTVRLCMVEADGATGPLGADSRYTERSAAR